MKFEMWMQSARPLLAAGLLFTPGVLRSADLQESPVRSLEGLVGRWVDLRGQIDNEERTWTTQSAQWRQEMVLLRAEQEKLTTALAVLEEAGETQQERSAGLLAQREQQRAVLAQLEAVLRKLQPRVAALQPLVPPALLTVELAAALQPEVAEDGGANRLTARLQRMLGALKALETLQAGIHTTRALIALPGEPRREMDVLFLGLARGFAVTTDNQVAAAGYPAEDGWHWQALPASGPSVRQLIQIARQEEPPALVLFPVAGGVTPAEAP